MAELSASSAHAAVHPPGLRHHFEDMEQQHEAGNLGMWVFLVTEILFFGGLFAAYTIYRSLYLPGFEAGSRLLDVKLGRHEYCRVDRQQLDDGAGGACGADGETQGADFLFVADDGAGSGVSWNQVR